MIRHTSIALLIVMMITVAVEAQTRPFPPTNPRSVQECNDFTVAYKKYLDRLRDDYRSCMSNSSSVPLSQWVKGFRCTSVTVNVPPACVVSSGEWDCAVGDYGKLANECLKTARSNEEASSSAMAEADMSLQKAMDETASGVPGAAAFMASKLAQLWTDRTNNAVAKQMLLAAKINGYGKTADNIEKVLNGSHDVAQSTQEVTALLNRNGNLISREMTAVATKGAARVGRTAVAALDAEFSKYDGELSSAIEEAKAAAPQKAFENLIDAWVRKWYDSSSSFSPEQTRNNVIRERVGMVRPECFQDNRLVVTRRCIDSVGWALSCYEYRDGHLWYTYDFETKAECLELMKYR